MALGTNYARIGRKADMITAICIYMANWHDMKHIANEKKRLDRMNTKQIETIYKGINFNDR